MDRVNTFRKVGLAFTLTLSFASLLFYQFSGLYFFLDERAELYPVSQLKSQGGDENLLVSIGFVIFLLLAFFFAWRYKRPISGIDASMLLLALLLQGVSLYMIEVGSFTLSMQASHGWILMLWLFAFGSLWVLFFAMMGHLKR